jgi:hypothetical protein
MRLLTALGLAALAGLTDAFFAPSSCAVQRRVSSVYSTQSADETPCAISPDFADASSLVNVPNGASSIRSGIVTNYKGDFVRLQDVISNTDPHVVIFLRHMG